MHKRFSSMPRKSKQSRRKGSRRKGGPNKPSVRSISRSLLKGSLPKHYLEMKSLGMSKEGRADHLFQAVGCEVAVAVHTSKGTVAQFSPLINPARADFAPRLSSIAAAYERYRVRSLKVKFHTAAPATRSGAIGLLIDFDPSDEQPGSLISIAQNEAGMVGTIASDLEVSASWPSTDPFYLTTPDLSVSTEAQWRYPGRIWVITEQSSTADDDLLAGYISLHYEVELLRLRPITQQVLAGHPRDATITDSSFTLSEAFDTMIGWWDWFDSQDEAGAQSSTYPATTNENSWMESIGEWATSYLLDLEAETTTVSVPRHLNDYIVVEEDKESKLGDSESSVVESWVNPAFDPNVLRLIPKAQRLGFVMAHHADLPPQRKIPAAAGDFVVRLLGMPTSSEAGTGEAVIASTTYAPGTGAYEAAWCYLYEILSGPYRVYLNVDVVTAGKQRLLVGDSCVSNVQLSALE